MSTSIALVTCVEVSSDARMCWAMPRRIALIGSKRLAGRGLFRGRSRRGRRRGRDGHGRGCRRGAGGATGAGGAGVSTTAAAGASTTAASTGACDDRLSRGEAVDDRCFDRRVRRPVLRPPGPRRRARVRLGCAGSGLDEREDVLLRDAAADAGAVHARRVDAVLAGDAGDDRRDEGPSVRRSGRRDCSGRQRTAATGAASPRAQPRRPARLGDGRCRRGYGWLRQRGRRGGSGAAAAPRPRRRCAPGSSRRRRSRPR